LRKSKLVKTVSVTRNEKLSTKMIDTFCDLYKKGKRVVDIAKITGISHTTISKYLNKRGLKIIKKREENNVNEGEICELYREGNTISSISRITGNSRQIISNCLEKNGLRKKPIVDSVNKLTDIEKTRIIELYNEGKNDRKISNEMERDVRTIRKIRILHNLPPIKRTLSDEQKYAMKHERNPKYDEKYMKAVQLYYKHMDWSFEQIAAVVYEIETEENVDDGYIGYPSKYQVSSIKTKIGKHLMIVCRSQEDCAFKSLLPETKIKNVRENENKTE